MTIVSDCLLLYEFRSRTSYWTDYRRCVADVASAYSKRQPTTAWKRCSESSHADQIRPSLNWLPHSGILDRNGHRGSLSLPDTSDELPDDMLQLRVSTVTDIRDTNIKNVRFKAKDQPRKAKARTRNLRPMKRSRTQKSRSRACPSTRLPGIRPRPWPSARPVQDQGLEATDKTKWVTS